MNRKRAQSSSLFLMELILAIAIFAAASAVCVQFFAKAHRLSQDAEHLNFASAECASAAEIIASCTEIPDQSGKDTDPAGAVFTEIAEQFTAVYGQTEADIRADVCTIIIRYDTGDTDDAAGAANNADISSCCMIIDLTYNESSSMISADVRMVSSDADEKAAEAVNEAAEADNEAVDTNNETDDSSAVICQIAVRHHIRRDRNEQ